MAGKLDARAKLASTLCALILIASTPSGAWSSFTLYGIIVGGIWALGRISFLSISSRVLTGLPFILMAAALMGITNGWERGLTVFLKGTLGLILISMLVITTEVALLVWAIRKLGAPRIVNLIAAMMIRYIAMLSEEFSRMSRGRAARAGSSLAGVALFQTHGNQAGLLLVRSWERAERIHQAMLSRGFTGMMPELTEKKFGSRDVFFTATVIFLFALARILFLD